MIEWAGLSDVGKVRSQNEDCIGQAEQIDLLVVADGMGGHHAGEIASRIAVDTILEQLEQIDELPASHGIDPATGCSELGLAMRQAIVQANRRIYAQAQRNPEQFGMGTTVVTCILRDGHIHFAYVGDSRLYRYRGGDFTCLTQDHTVRQEVIDRGLHAGRTQEVHTPGHIITRALGVGPSVAIDVRDTLALPHDLFLLCTDGLYDMLTDAEIATLLSKHANNLAQAAEALVARANDRGGKDNVSVMLARAAPRQARRHGPWWARLFKRARVN